DQAGCKSRWKSGEPSRHVSEQVLANGWHYSVDPAVNKAVPEPAHVGSKERVDAFEEHVCPWPHEERGRLHGRAVYFVAALSESAHIAGGKVLPLPSDSAANLEATGDEADDA